ncbi:enoyl-CoA hydratase/isomerase family protein, partial [Salinisphaera sp.]|uniref:enoyl-CoA hydratase/isomerase family protein n=1 Tax=Salinisphaera sp. TaxID=1914330 RepID=UPI002D79DFFA
MSDSRVHETEIRLNSGARLGRLTLDSPAALNALRLEMVEAVQSALERWEAREDIVAILIDADSDRAFCAGGDIVNLYRSAIGQADAD